MITARNRAKGLWESPKLNHASFFSLLGGARTAVQFLTSVPTRIFVYSHFSQSKSFVYFSISQSKHESRKARNSNQGRTGALVPLLFTPIPHRKTKWSKTGSGTGFCRLATTTPIQKIAQQQSGTGLQPLCLGPTHTRSRCWKSGSGCKSRLFTTTASRSKLCEDAHVARLARVDTSYKQMCH